jgi:hypothetical protein
MNLSMSCRALVFVATLITLPFVAAQDEYVSSNIDYSLTSKDIEKLSELAMNGSPEAASKIVDYYYLEKGDKKKSKFWALIGAENGSLSSQFVIFQLLSVSKSSNDQRRALFWLKRSAEGGYEKSVSTYAVCNSLDADLQNETKTPCFGPE